MSLRRPTSKPAASQADASSQRDMVRFLARLAWRYRRGCFAVLLIQIVLLAMGLSGLGLMGLGVDFIREQVAVQQAIGVPKPTSWPFGLVPDAAYSQAHPMRVLAVVTGCILVLALLRGLLNYLYTISVTRLVQGQIVVDLRSQVYGKMQRLSFQFYDAHASASMINRVTGDVQSVRLFVDGVAIPCIVLDAGAVPVCGHERRLLRPSGGDRAVVQQRVFVHGRGRACLPAAGLQAGLGG